MASNGYLRALNDLVAELADDLDDFYPDTLASSRFRGVQYGLPAMMSAEPLVYRIDLLDRAGLAPPRTVSQTLETARRLSAFGKPVLNLRRTADGFDAERVDGEEMRPMFLSLEARQTVEYLLELMQYSPANVLSMNWYDRAVAYQRGKVALAYSHTMLAPLYECDPTSPAYRKTGYVPHPTGPRGQPIAPMGGYALAIPANLAAERLEGARVASRCSRPRARSSSIWSTAASPVHGSALAAIRRFKRFLRWSRPWTTWSPTVTFGCGRARRSRQFPTSSASPARKSTIFYRERNRSARPCATRRIELTLACASSDITNDYEVALNVVPLRVGIQAMPQQYGSTGDGFFEVKS
jgi:hypothetical protein